MWNNMNEHRNETDQNDTINVNYNEVPNYYAVPGEFNKEKEVALV